MSDHSAPNEPIPLAIDRIRTDGGTQARAGLDAAIVAEYAATWQDLSYQQNGLARIPPIVVFFDGTDYWLADGFHRLAAYQQFIEGPSASASPRALLADVRQGMRRDAVLFACGANAQHGLRRTNADKRRAVETLLRDSEWRQWSDREIARRCNVSHDLPALIRKELGLTGDSASERTYTTKHGTTATMSTAGISVANGERKEASDIGASSFPRDLTPLLPPDLIAAGWRIDSLPVGEMAGVKEDRATQGYTTLAALIAALRAAEHGERRTAADVADVARLNEIAAHARREATEAPPAAPDLDSLLYRLSEHGWDHVRSYTRGKGNWIYHEFHDAAGPDRDVVREMPEGALAMWADELDTAAAAKAERKRRNDLAVSACHMNIQQMRDHPDQMEYYRTYAKHRAAEASDPLLTQKLNAEIVTAEKEIKAAREQAQPLAPAQPAATAPTNDLAPPAGWEWEQKGTNWRLVQTSDKDNIIAWHARPVDALDAAKALIWMDEQEEGEAYSDRIESVIQLCQEITERTHCEDQEGAISAWHELGACWGQRSR